MRHEYVALREEIKETKARIFSLAGFALVAMPSSYGLAQAFKIEALVLSLPILICTIQLVYLAESRSLMRCGEYIKKRIEEPIARAAGSGEALGWEHWLSEQPAAESSRRTVDKMLAYFFYLIFLFYYVASVQLAAATASNQWGVIGLAVSLGFYIGIGVVFAAFLIRNYRHTTTTSD